MATFLPLYVAVWTCPSDAAASGSAEKSLKTSSHGFPNSLETISLALAPLNPGTSSCNVLRTSVYSTGRTSVRVDTTWPSFTNVGPSRSKPSRIKVAASILAASISSSVAVPSFRSLRGLSTLKTHLRANFHTSALRRRAEELPRVSQPRSSSSPSGTSPSISKPVSSMCSESISAAVDSPSMPMVESDPLRTSPSVLPTMLPRILFALALLPSSLHSSTSSPSISHSSSISSSAMAAASALRASAMSSSSTTTTLLDSLSLVDSSSPSVGTGASTSTTSGFSKVEAHKVARDEAAARPVAFCGTAADGATGTKP
mmetsp:Transcript_34702/g.70184  ORF Transcript_34702/g.70184 Transcript_34702/m.70184 type:complete len:315 (+) Transcript_34702:2296-3240(+)